MTNGAAPGLFARFASPGAILCFHGATSANLPSASVANIPAARLIDLIDSVAAVATLAPLRDVIDRHRKGRSVRGMISLTFDDAYASLDLIADYLSHRSIPVTVFVANAYSETGKAFWWDRVDDLYEHVPAARWRAFESAVGLPDSFRVGQPPEFGPLRPLRQWLLHANRGRTTPLLDDELTRLEREIGRTTLHRPMTLEEIEAFSRRTGATVAPHSATHPVLPLLAADELRDEMHSSLWQLLERFESRVVRAIAVPFGLYDASVVNAADDLGLTTLTLAHRTLTRSGQGGPLPRLSIGTGTSSVRLLALVSGAREIASSWIGSPRASAYPELPGPTS
jgi:peptidoglycan/xylan/chitin deacetylase (PgdA/CDA1 family)